MCLWANRQGKSSWDCCGDAAKAGNSGNKSQSEHGFAAQVKWKSNVEWDHIVAYAHT